MTTPTPRTGPGENPEIIPPQETVESVEQVKDPIDRNLEDARAGSEDHVERVEGQARETAETVEQTQAQLEAAKLERQAAAESGKTPEAPNPPSGESVETQWYNPTTWTPEEREKATQIAVIGTGVVGGLLLMKWIWGKMKKAGETVKEKTGGVWSAVKFGTLAAVLTVGGYFGYRGVVQLKKKFDTLREIDEKIRELEKMKKTLTGPQLEAAEQQIEELFKERERVERGESDTKEEENVPAEESSQEEKGEILSEESEKHTIELLMAQGIVTFYEWDGWDLEKGPKLAQVNGLIENHRKTRMSSVFDAIDEDGEPVMSKNPFTNLPQSDSENRLKSAEYMIRFCGAYRKEVEKYLMRRDGINEQQAAEEVLKLTLHDFVHDAMACYASIIPIAGTFGKYKNLEDAINNLDMTKISRGDVGAQRELELFVAEESGLAEDELSSIDSVKLLNAIFTQTSGGDIASKMLAPAEGKETVEQIVVRKLLEKMAASNTHLYILPCFHGLLPTEEEGKSDEELARTYLLDRMSAQQAMRFYLYRRMIDSGNPSGLVLMQMEVIKFVAETEYFGVDKYRIAIRMLEKVGSGGMAAVAEQWEKLGVQISPEFIENAESSMAFVGQMTLYGLAGSALETGRLALATYVENPVLVHAGMEGMRGYAIYMNINPHTVGVNLDEWRGAVSGRPMTNAIRNRLPFVISTDAIKKSATQYEILYERIHAVSDEKVRKVLETQFRQCLNSPFSKNRWTILAKNLADNHLHLQGTDAAEAAVKFGNNIEMQKTLNIARFSYKNGFLDFFLGKSLRTYERGRQTMKDAIGATPQVLAKIKNSEFVQEIAQKTGAKLDDVIAILSKIEVPPSVLEAFTKSKGALQMLFNASKGGVPAMEYLMRIGTIAQKIGPALGKALVGIDIVVCAIEICMNRIRIAQTDNPELKELYAMRDWLSGSNAIAGTAMGIAAYKSGFALSGAASWGTAEAVTTGISFLPLVIVAAGARYAQGELEAVSEAWMKTETDWANETSAELRRKLAEMPPGEHTYWQEAAGGPGGYNWLVMNSEEYAEHSRETLKRIEDANTSTRTKQTRAYLAQMTELMPEEGETPEEFEQRFAQFQLDQTLFVHTQTEGSFSLQLNDVYRNAHTHAELKTLSRKLKDCNGSQMITVPFTNEMGEDVELEFDLAKYDEFKNLHDRIDGVSAMSVLHAYRQQQRGMAMLQSAFLKESGGLNSHHQRDFILQRTMLMEVRHELAQCDQALRTADLDGWEWTGGEGETRDHMRYAMNVEFRKMLRAESDRLQELPLATPSDLEESVHRLQSYLQQPTHTFAQMAEKGTYGGAAEFSGQSEVLSDIGWNMANLYVYPPSTETPSNT